MSAVMTSPISACGVPHCVTCQPHRLAHWYCAQCQAGPFKFDKHDPGAYQIKRPWFERGTQKYVMGENGVGRWIYGARRICSETCHLREKRAILAGEVETMQKRPDLAPAIQAHLAAETATQTEGPATAQDDLGAMRPLDGGSYVPGIDDL